MPALRQVHRFVCHSQANSSTAPSRATSPGSGSPAGQAAAVAQSGFRGERLIRNALGHLLAGADWHRHGADIAGLLRQPCLPQLHHPTGSRREGFVALPGERRFAGCRRMVAAQSRQGIAEELCPGALRGRPGGRLFHHLRGPSPRESSDHRKSRAGWRAAAGVGGLYGMGGRSQEVRGVGAVRNRAGVLHLNHHPGGPVHALLEPGAHGGGSVLPGAQPLGWPHLRQSHRHVCRLCLLAFLQRQRVALGFAGTRLMDRHLVPDELLAALHRGGIPVEGPEVCRTESRGVPDPEQRGFLQRVSADDAASGHRRLLEIRFDLRQRPAGAGRSGTACPGGGAAREERLSYAGLAARHRGVYYQILRAATRAHAGSRKCGAARRRAAAEEPDPARRLLHRRGPGSRLGHRQHRANGSAEPLAGPGPGRAHDGQHSPGQSRVEG